MMTNNCSPPSPPTPNSIYIGKTKHATSSSTRTRRQNKTHDMGLIILQLPPSLGGEGTATTTIVLVGSGVLDRRPNFLVVWSFLVISFKSHSNSNLFRGAESCSSGSPSIMAVGGGYRTLNFRTVRIDENHSLTND